MPYVVVDGVRRRVPEACGIDLDAAASAREAWSLALPPAALWATREPTAAKGPVTAGKGGSCGSLGSKGFGDAAGAHPRTEDVGGRRLGASSSTGGSKRGAPEGEVSARKRSNI